MGTQGNHHGQAHPVRASPLPENRHRQDAYTIPSGGGVVSIESLSIALHHSRSKGSAKLVLLGIANHDGDGGSFPKIATLAKYANIHPRNVVKCLNTLGALGEIIIHQQAGGTAKTPETIRPNLYEFILTCPADCDRTSSHRLKGEKLGRNYKGQYVPQAVENSTSDLVAETPPSGAGVTTPSGAGVTTPSGAGVTTKNHQVEPPIESGVVPRLTSDSTAVEKPAAKAAARWAKQPTPEEIERARRGAAMARAALRGEASA
jgi:hypothetical protein